MPPRSLVRTSCRFAIGAPTVEDVRSPVELADAFRAQGLKITPQRQLLFRLLHDNTAHPTADALYAQASERMPGISLRTVYQTLTDLTAMGELRQVTFDSGPGHFDPNITDHHHAVCDSCGAIADVYVDGTDRLAVAGLDGFSAASASIVFHGSCTSCSPGNDSASASSSSSSFTGRNAGPSQK